MKEEKRQSILQKSLQIKQLLQEQFEKQIDWMQYYENFEFKGANLAENQIVVVKLAEQLPKKDAKKEPTEEMQPDIVYTIFNKENELIATVAEDGVLQFTPEYKNKLEKQFPKFYSMLHLEGNEFQLPEEMTDDDITLTENDLPKIEEEQLGEGTQKQDTQKNNKDNNQEEEKKIETETEEVRKQKIAKTLGIKPEDVRAFAQIDPNKKITEDSNLRDILPETKQYDRIEVSCVTTPKQNQGDGKFCILGIKKDGTRELLQTVQSIEGVATNKKVISINENGEKVEENAVQGLMRMEAKEREDGIAFSLGDYGMLDISYVRDVMNKETRRSTPIDTLELENRKTLSPEVKENAADDIHEVREESENFRKKQEQGKEKQDLQDIDKQRNENIEVAKAKIAEETADLINEGATKAQVTEFIREELDTISSVSFTEQEKTYLTSQIEAEAIDLSRFPTRTHRSN